MLTRTQIYLEDQTALLVQNIQLLVSSIRSDAEPSIILTQTSSIADVVGKVISATEGSNTSLRKQVEPILKKLAACRQKLVDAEAKGAEIEEGGKWKMWTSTLPPIAFEIARETKELVLRVDIVDADKGREDDFS